jgi:hypothetical protein
MTIRKSRRAGPPPVVDGEGKLSAGVPDNVKVAIATAIMSYSNMESSLEWFIWDITGLTYDDGRLLTKVDTSDKISIAKALAGRYQIQSPVYGPDKKSLWTLMNELASIRNLIAHGVWGMHALTVPVASSFRLKGEENRVVSEGFSLERLEAIARRCDNAKVALEKMGRAAQSLRRQMLEQYLQHRRAPT